MSHTLTAYRVAPQMEFKAANELREDGHRAYVPRSRNRKASRFTGRFWPIAPGYVFSDAVAKSAWAKHVKSQLGPVNPRELARLYEGRASRRADTPCPYVVGQSVMIGEVPGRVVEIRGRTCRVAVTMMGKQHVTAIHYEKLRPG